MIVDKERREQRADARHFVGDLVRLLVRQDVAVAMKRVRGRLDPGRRHGVRVDAHALPAHDAMLGVEVALVADHRRVQLPIGSGELRRVQRRTRLIPDDEGLAGRILRGAAPRRRENADGVEMHLRAVQRDALHGLLAGDDVKERLRGREIADAQGAEPILTWRDVADAERALIVAQRSARNVAKAVAQEDRNARHRSVGRVDDGTANLCCEASREGKTGGDDEKS